MYLARVEADNEQLRAENARLKATAAEAVALHETENTRLEKSAERAWGKVEKLREKLDEASDTLEAWGKWADDVQEVYDDLLASHQRAASELNNLPDTIYDSDGDEVDVDRPHCGSWCAGTMHFWHGDERAISGLPSRPDE